MSKGKLRQEDLARRWLDKQGVSDPGKKGVRDLAKKLGAAVDGPFDKSAYHSMAEMIREGKDPTRGER